MKILLDSLFKYNKFSIIFPVLMSVAVCLLFAVFGDSADKFKTIASTAVLSVVWYFGVFLVLFVQVKNPSCPEWFLNFLEFLITFLFSAYGLVSTILFLVSRCQNFNIGMCLAIVTYSSAAWIHGKRQKLR